MTDQPQSRAFLQHAERLFVVADQRATEDSQGLPLSPGRWHSAPQATWEQWKDAPCVVVLADPNMEKTREFQHQVERAPAAGELPHYTDWQPWYVGADLLELVDDPEAFARQLAAGEPVTRYVDGLDEGRLKTPSVFEVLMAALRRLK